MPKLQDKALDRASDVRPYLERAFKDEQVREDVKSAILLSQTDISTADGLDPNSLRRALKQPGKSDGG